MKFRGLDELQLLYKDTLGRARQNVVVRSEAVMIPLSMSVGTIEILFIRSQVQEDGFVVWRATEGIP